MRKQDLEKYQVLIYITAIILGLTVGEALNVSAEITTWREFMSHYGNLCVKEPEGVPILIARLMAFAIIYPVLPPRLTGDL